MQQAPSSIVDKIISQSARPKTWYPSIHSLLLIQTRHRMCFSMIGIVIVNRNSRNSKSNYKLNQHKHKLLNLKWFSDLYKVSDLYIYLLWEKHSLCFWGFVNIFVIVIIFHQSVSNYQLAVLYNQDQDEVRWGETNWRYFKT